VKPFGAGRIAWRVAVLVAVPVLVVFLPKWLHEDYFNYRLAFVGIYFIAIIGLNVLTGYNGQISLGHGAFMAIGAYTTAILNVNYGVGLYWTIPIAGILTGLFGFAFGFPALRLSGVYLALATFGLAVSVPLVAKRFEGFTGGGQGKTVSLPSSPIGGLTSNEWISYLTWAIAGGMFALAWFLLRGDLGRAFRAVRDAPIAAISSGVSLARFKTLAFGIAAAYAGVAGALLTIAIAFVNPDTFPVSLSILLLTGAVVGGLGSLEGMLFGAVFIQFAPGWGERLAKHVHYNEATTQSTVFYGLILLLVLFVMPGGAAQLLHQLGTGLKRLRLWLYSRADSRATA
jgi:branched-chain amino acid transport system permease protein